MKIKQSKLLYMAALLLSVFPAVVSASLLGPSPYVSFDDSPFFGESFSYFYLEDFEDLSLNTPGASVDQGSPINSSIHAAIDSVDADDGVIDGSGATGASIFHPTSMTFTFDAVILGNLPTNVGIVWTDGTPGGLVTFEAFDENGITLGALSANMGDSSFFGETAEDRFFGAVNAGGISSISITDNGSINFLEVDHLQYGLAAVPVPAAVWLFGSGLVGLVGVRRRRS